MLSVTLTGAFPEVDVDVRSGLDKVGQYMVRSVQKNFERGGRPSWPATRSGETPLVNSGRLYRTINYRVEGSSVTIGAGAGLDYAWIHQRGGVTHPTVTQKSKRFFWAMFFETGDEKWKWMALKPVGSKMSVLIQPRPFMMFQPEDIEFIQNIFLANAITITRTDGTTIQLGSAPGTFYY